MTALAFEGSLEFPDYPNELLFVKRFILRPDGTLAFHMIAQHPDGKLEVSGTTKPADSLFGWKTSTTANFQGSKRSLEVEISVFLALAGPDGSYCEIRGAWHDKGSGQKLKFEGILDPYRTS